MALKRYKMEIAYDGAAFHGWQIQAPAGQPPLRTVQGVVREAVIRTVAQPVIVQGASRTDAGVHALGQVAHFEADTRIPTERLGQAISSRLPADVEIRSLYEVPSSFEAIGSAVNKQYRYRFWLGDHRPLGLRHLVYPCRFALDVAPMRLAAKRLIGEHDFASFAAAGHNRQSTVRTIYDCDVIAVSGDGRMQADEVQVTVSGNGFLYNMVRIIAGTLMEVGRGHQSPEWIDHLLTTKDRREAGPTLRPEGLCLEWIRYRPEDDPKAGDDQADAVQP